MINKPKGTIDVFGKTGRLELYINDMINDCARKYNYEYIRTPLFENSELFHRSVGESSDIVSKETYDFIDRGNRQMTLRPEGTASVVRSYLENKMYANNIQPVKLYYNGAMYRYERPQAGRTREFTQFGVEVLGSATTSVDVEVIAFAYNLLLNIGLADIKVVLNSLGDKESRDNYRRALVDYFSPLISQMCLDCQARLLKNPLRILDCKIDCESDIMKKSPKLSDYLSDNSKKRFKKICEMLDKLKINYEIRENLVRGLDYYNDTVFEIEVECPEMGKQNVIGGGGRYDGLVEQLGGASTSCFGFAFGLSRLMEVLNLKMDTSFLDYTVDAYIIDEDNTNDDIVLTMATSLRDDNYTVVYDLMDKNIKNKYKQAEALNSMFYIIINKELLSNNLVKIKNSKTKEINEIDVEYVSYYLAEKIDNMMGEEYEENLF